MVKRRKKRKTVRSRTMVKRRKKGRRRKGSSGGKITPLTMLVGAVGYGLIEPFADEQISKLNINVADDYLKGGLGVLGLWKLRNPYLKSMSASAIAIAVARVTQSYMGGSNGGSNGDGNGDGDM